MLISFIGSPQSGKTTTASMLFASMKETGQVVEYSTEQARLYIAKLRAVNGLSPYDKITLTDEDQYKIMQLQVEQDELLSKACGEASTVISDTSPLNSMLYMSEELRNSKEILDLANRSLAITNVAFYMLPIYRPYLNDPNRIHTQEQSKLIDSQIPSLLAKFPALKSYQVDGKVSERLLIVQTKIYFP